MYWCAASTPDGNGQMMVEKWKILPFHIMNIHRNPQSPCYKRCGHGRLRGESRNRLWLKPGSKASVKMEEVLLKPSLVEDISKLSPKYQTSTLEAKHSLDIMFVPKHTAFSYWGMFVRLSLSALHYNENAHRMQAMTADGRPQYAIRYPKAKKGKHTVRQVKTKPTYGYCTDIINKTFTSYKESPKMLRQRMENLKASTPLPLAASAQRPNKDEAVKEFISRYNNSQLVH